MDKLSYALGLSFGQQLAQSGIEIADYQSFAKGVEAVLTGSFPEVPIEECQRILAEYFQNMKKNADEKAKAAKKDGEEFLVQNAKRPEVKTTASGLQYEIIKEGNGKKPSATDKVKVHYHGTLIDGTVFDSSVLRGQSAQFGVNQVISGWGEALQLMNTGAKYKLYIPSDLAYGAQGAGDLIKPHSALVFEVELLDIV
ncbi:MAG: FKBP-type peptidyl-prolyl cis-trans isomerase [Prevotellaceae bacterium]|jgi:FKBP-type peptidyl-prolyl cis-trans isomerase FklB|nr:FKBP-type peptidyl-prolyl cis-trans isomerase [Prevotellaceae bacterium]